MERVIVEVFLPASGKKYDVRIPLDLNSAVVSGMVAKALAELSDGSYRASGSSSLAWQDSGRMLDTDKTMRECRVQNMSRLILI